MKQEIENYFTYHAPRPDQIPKYNQLREDARLFASEIIDLCPDSRERSTAIAKLREVVMWANAAIACNDEEIRECPMID